MTTVGVLIAALVGLSACGAQQFPTALSTPTTPTTVTSPTTSTTVAGQVPLAPAAVQAGYVRLFPTPPIGFLPVAVSSPGSGYLSHDVMVNKAKSPTAARNLLSVTGYIDGFSREYVNADDTMGFYVHIYRFTDADGARLYATEDYSATSGLGGGVHTDAAEFTDGSVVTIKGATPDQYNKFWQVALATSGSYVVAVPVWSSTKWYDESFLEKLARAQVARLPA